MKEIEVLTNNIKKQLGDFKIDIAIILGSGWNGCVSKVETYKEINYADIDGLPQCTVKGHKGKFIFGTLSGKNVGIMQGRFHLYEGYSAFETTIGLQLLNKLGATTCILTNASGGVNLNYKTNDIVIVNDVINLSGRNALVGLVPTEEKPVFISMGDCIDKSLQEKARLVCEKQGLNYQSGVYSQNLGPTYETSAEVRMLRNMGVDCVGMSTVQEVIMARYLKMKVLCLSYISNMAQGIKNEVLTHEEVLDNAKIFQGKGTNLLVEIVANI